MSVIRPRPPTDPIDHVVLRPGPSAGGGPAMAGYGAWLSRAEGSRDAVAGTPAAAVATALLAAYGTLGAPARRAESRLFALLDRARRVREAVDLVVVVGDHADRAVVDLLLATCCHPFHNLLPRHERGGRPRILTLSADDDDDRVQAAIDMVGIATGDRVADGWLPLGVGRREEAASREILALLETTWHRGRCGGDAEGDRALHDAPPGVDDPSGGGLSPWTAILPAAIAGVDVVRLLEGAAAMERRFREAAAEANPVLTAAALRGSLAEGRAGQGPLRRRLRVPAHWHGLVAWHESLPWREEEEGDAVGRFVTPIVVGESRRAPFGARRRAAAEPRHAVDSAADRIDLPRADEHTIGQLLALLLLENEVGRRLG